MLKLWRPHYKTGQFFLLLNNSTDEKIIFYCELKLTSLKYLPTGLKGIFYIVVLDR